MMAEITEMESDRDEVSLSMVYQAAKKGCVVTLNSLIREYPLILTEISFTTFKNTPLHISSAHGHLDFSKELLMLKPELASELDNRRRSSLHFAAAEGHVEIARALLHENKDVCLQKDQDGRIPLHYAAMRGRVDLIELLISTQHQSVFAVLPSGETALHLCVQHNHLEALKQLVDSAGHENTEFLNAKELQSGNTILHLAVMLKQVETVEYLLPISGVKEETLDHKGYKAADLVDNDQAPKDFNTLRMQRLVGINKDNKSLIWMQLITERLKDYKREWLKEMRGSIMVAASLIATTTFQTAIDPPGGVWQTTSTDPDIDHQNAAFKCNIETCIAGTSMLAHIWPSEYRRFIKFNSVAFLASLSVILLIVGGFPLKSKVCVWLLTMAMCVTLTFTALTFLYGMLLVTPHHIEDFVLGKIYRKSFDAWIGLLASIGVYHTIHFGIWLFRHLRYLLRHFSNRIAACSSS